MYYVIVAGIIHFFFWKFPAIPLFKPIPLLVKKYSVIP